MPPPPLPVGLQPVPPPAEPQGVGATVGRRVQLYVTLLGVAHALPFPFLSKARMVQLTDLPFHA